MISVYGFSSLDGILLTAQSTIFFTKIFSLSKQNRILLDAYAIIFNNYSHNRADSKLWLQKPGKVKAREN